MRLLIDAGNSRIKWCLVEGGVWSRVGVLPLEQADTLQQSFPLSLGIQQIWVSNVAGEAVAQQIRSIAMMQPNQIYFIGAKKTQCGISNGYEQASQLGSDRWAALIAAWKMVRGACLVVNSGTATTIDALSAQGEFVGGLILPGIALMQLSLVEKTEQLKAECGKSVNFPLNTADGILNGAIQANCGAIERQHALLGGGDVPVILSGGGAQVLQSHLYLPARGAENLVLHGLQIIASEVGIE